MELNIDYISDLHLTHYISKKESITKIDKLVQDKISMQVKGDILVVAGDIDEDINRVSELLYSCSKYYKKVSWKFRKTERIGNRYKIELRIIWGSFFVAFWATIKIFGNVKCIYALGAL